MQKKGKITNTVRFYISLTAIVMAVIAVIFAVAFSPRISIRLIGKDEITLEVGEEYIESGCIARYGKEEFYPYG